MHLVRDVLAALPDLYLVHDVSDGLHGISHVPLAELFLGRDELDAHGGQDALGDGGIGVVTERAGAHVDHHVADLRGGFDVAQQLTENWAFGDGLGRVARFDELAGDRCVQATTALRADLTLGGDGVTVLVDVDGGVHLPGCRHPQVQHRLRPLGDIAAGQGNNAVQTQELVEVPEGGSASSFGRRRDGSGWGAW
ncbi:MAG: hypothetical protein HG423_008480 [Propionibacterium sp.]|nr:hypothetical protein [Propionibacterium sp.]